jgi:molecular chaperone IbpA
MNKALSIFNQLRPLSIGFDDVFDHFERMFDSDISAINYPPYNIVKTGPEKYNIEVALAGYGKNDVNVDFAEGLLTIKSVKDDKDEKDGILHKGIAKRHFSRTFTIADDVEIKDAELKDGLLKVFLKRIVPEGKEARQIKIN